MRKFWIGLLTGIALWSAVLLCVEAHGGSKDRAFHVLSGPTEEDPHGAWILPYVAPPIHFRVVEGEVPLYGVDCEQRQEGTHVMLVCDGKLKLQMDGIDLMR